MRLEGGLMKISAQSSDSSLVLFVNGCVAVLRPQSRHSSVRDSTLKGNYPGAAGGTTAEELGALSHRL